MCFLRSECAEGEWGEEGGMREDVEGPSRREEDETSEQKIDDHTSINIQRITEAEQRNIRIRRTHKNVFDACKTLSQPSKTTYV